MLDIYRKIFGLLSPRERRRFMQLMALLLVSGLAEAAGVASIAPFLIVISDPTKIETNEILARLHEILGAPSAQDFMIYLGVGLFVILLCNIALRGFTQYAMLRFTAMRNYTLSLRLMSQALLQPYSWFLQRNSADISKSILTEVGLVVSGAIAPAMQVLSQGVVVLCVVALLLTMEPVAAIAAAVLMGAFYSMLLLIFRRYMRRIGDDRVKANQQRFQVAAEAFGGIKTVKLLGMEMALMNRFEDSQRRMAHYQAISQAVAQVPRHLVEVVIFGGMLVFVLVLLIQNDGRLEEVIPTLGLFAFAGMRLFPPAQQIYAHISTLGYGRGALNSLVEDFEQARTPPSLPAGKGRIGVSREIRFENVFFSYPNAERSALRGLNMTIPAGSTVGVVGGTGAGKTTAIDLLLGLLTPDNGRILIDDVALKRETLRPWQRSLGYVPQDIFLIDASIRANIAFGAAPEEIDDAAVERAARIAELHDFVMSELPQGYDTISGERGVRLSGGQRQRIGIARALYHDPDVLVFDEATSALDNLTERALMSTIHNLGERKTIVMIAHRLSTVRDCDTIFFLKNGRVHASGRFEELVETNADFRKLAGEG